MVHYPQPAVPSPTHPPDNDTSGPQGPVRSLALHTLGWKAFQDLGAQICEEILHGTVSIYREAQDGGQDAVFQIRSKPGEPVFTGTVQCKFTSAPNRHLKLSDLTSEKASIIDLVSKGQAHTYYFLTNMSVDAPIAKDIRDMLANLGVLESHVLGCEWITQKIRESSRLRALVPRVYGLGDLSTILDERRADQTKALLGHLMPSLGTYVPTAAHRSAVRILGEHGIVLLLGAPATGKSMLAAILATTALNGEGHQCFQAEGPIEVLSSWNPNESGRFFWIDDAFGPNQLREDFVDHWIAIMNKVKAAVGAGNRFVLTSRSHIWAAAKNKLGTRNHPKLADGTAVVEVGSLSPDERSQILYNHIKNGNQPIKWKQKIKPHLDKIAIEANFLPEIARRLGDITYTSGMLSIPTDLFRFIKEPMEFLKESIGELNSAQRAALTIVFIYRSKLPVNATPTQTWHLVCDKFGTNISDILNSLQEFSNSFLVLKSDGGNKFWSFYHPTIADAVASILRSRPDLVELYLKGTRVEALLSEVVCTDARAIRDAVTVPTELDDLLTSRLVETPQEININRQLMAFLADRSSDEFLRRFIMQDPQILSRETIRYLHNRHDPKLWLYARLNSLGLLPQEIRESEVQRLENAVLEDMDGSILDQDPILALFPPTRLLKLATKLGGDFIPSLEGHIESIVDSADLEIDPSDNFDDLNSFINHLGLLFFEDDRVQEQLTELKEKISDGIEQIAEMKNESHDSWDDDDVAPSVVSNSSRGRSLYSDVDS